MPDARRDVRLEHPLRPEAEALERQDAVHQIPDAVLRNLGAIRLVHQIPDVRPDHRLPYLQEMSGSDASGAVPPGAAEDVRRAPGAGGAQRWAGSAEELPERVPGRCRSAEVLSAA